MGMSNKSIYVISRIRPLNKTEINRNLYKAVIGNHDKLTVDLTKKTIEGYEKIQTETYNFDRA